MAGSQRTCEAFADQLAVTRDLRARGEHLIHERWARQADDTTFLLHALVFAARGTTSLAAVENLFLAGFAADALGIMRTICELTIDLAYILAEDTENRFELFFGYEHVANWREARFISELHELDPNLLPYRDLRRRYDSVKDRYERKSCWTAVSVADRVEQADLGHFYQLYSEGCAALHSGPKTLRESYSQDARGQLTIRTGARPPESARALNLAAFCYLRLLEQVAKLARDAAVLRLLHGPWMKRLGRVLDEPTL